MEHPPTTGDRLAAVIETHRTHTGRTYRNLADESLTSLATLHRKLRTGALTVNDIARFAAIFNTTPSALLAEADQNQDAA